LFGFLIIYFGISAYSINFFFGYIEKIYLQKII